MALWDIISVAQIEGMRDDSWMNDLRIYVLFISISVISGRGADDNERPQVK